MSLTFLQRIKKTQKGFTLLYSLLVISVVLMVTSSIFSILLKEMRLSAFGKASQIAYYAAETGGECALYWGQNGVEFDGSDSITCAGQPLTADSEFTINLGEGGCAVVSVEDQGTQTLIESRGYNICPGTGADARRAERGLRIVF
jgi:Tfp pilus assembly protein PilX